MELSPNDQLHGFTVLTREELPEIDGTAYVLSHRKSGARLLYLANDDANKAFSIAFKTPPADDTGVFHILEHSVLCGSDKFPVKEPFVDLLKSSMQTFLNAMTFPDKTLYPVASTNDQDLLNLADVYLDAVLHPAIYHKRAIFEQEGWHYELAADAEADEGDSIAGDVVAATEAEDGQAELVLNGVVYNEMKGALSDANSVLYDELQAALFPDTAYRFESGGTPRAIPDLTYEQFLDEHARHYRLDNSYLTLYGNVDLDRMLAFLDREYLSPVADEEAARAAARTEAGKPPLEPHALEAQAPVMAAHVVRDMDTAPENACAGLGYVIGDADERTRLVAVDILLDALMGSNEAPVKRALLDAGLADDVQAFVADGMLQPFAVVQLRGSKPGAAERFRAAFEDALRAVAEQGIDHTLVEASLSRAEFVMRERDFGMADGVALSMTALSGWLYDDEMATTYLRYEDDFALLRRELGTGYFERLMIDVFLESDHWALAEVRPLEGDGDAYEAERLRAAEAAMGPEDFARVADEEAELRRLQTEPDSPEALATLPRLSVADIGPAPVEPAYGLAEGTPVPCVRHDIPTRGIAYAYRYFDLGRARFEELPYVAVLALVLGKLGTARHTAAEIDTLVNGRLGSLLVLRRDLRGRRRRARSWRPSSWWARARSPRTWRPPASCRCEIMLETDFSDAGQDQGRAAAAAHRHGAGLRRTPAMPAAMARAGIVLPAGRRRARAAGRRGFLPLPEGPAGALRRARRTSWLHACPSWRGACSWTTDARWASRAPTTTSSASGRPGPSRAAPAPPSACWPCRPVVRNEAFIVPTDVCYAAQGFDRRADGAPYTGAWQVAARALSYDFLWNEVRVKGGAYGAGFRRGAHGQPALLLLPRPASGRDARALRRLGRLARGVRPEARGHGGLRGEHRGGLRRAAQGARAGAAPGRRLLRRAHARGARSRPAPR